ncbi:hypothetical protein [Nocardia carnea]|uniref:hypothetical protein n=1 Tax=Nocardia carnea TaxID=37328 RepID=UPI00245810CA|nr:hypothetical protein [Nocardia carnea]
MRRSSRTQRFITRIAATAVIAVAPLALTAAPALADPVAVTASNEVEDVSRPGRHGHGYGHGHGHGRHDHSWNGRHDHGAGWDRGHRNRHRHGHPGWNRGWNHGLGLGHGYGHGLPLPWFLPGTGSAF